MKVAALVMNSPRAVVPRQSLTIRQHCKPRSLANAKVSARQPCWSKTDSDVKLALKVIHFAINYRQTRGSISPWDYWTNRLWL